jgi:chromosome segregation ATPase
VRALKRTYDEMSDTITEQGERLTRAEDAARVTEKIITTLTAQYENVREMFIKARKRETEATRKNRKLQAQLKDARIQKSRTETRLAKITKEKDRVFDLFHCTICLDSVVDMISRSGHCFCKPCLVVRDALV